MLQYRSTLGARTDRATCGAAFNGLFAYENSTTQSCDTEALSMADPFTMSDSLHTGYFSVEAPAFCPAILHLVTVHQSHGRHARSGLPKRFRPLPLLTESNEQSR